MICYLWCRCTRWWIRLQRKEHRGCITSIAVIRCSYLAASTCSQAVPIRLRQLTNRLPCGIQQPQVCPWPRLPHLPLPTSPLPWLSSPPPTHFNYNSRMAPPQPTMPSPIDPIQKPTTRPLPGTFSSSSSSAANDRISIWQFPFPCSLISFHLFFPWKS